MKLENDNLDRQCVKYFFADLQICRSMYFFLHNIGVKRYKNLISNYDENGLTVRDHKLKNHASTKKDNITDVDVRNIVGYKKIKSF